MQGTLPKSWILTKKSQMDEESDCSQSQSNDKFQTKKEEWTRVSTLSQMRAIDIQTHDLGLDFKQEKSIHSIRSSLAQTRQQLIFDPERFARNDLELQIEKQRLKVDDAIAYGRQATELRGRFIDLAVQSAKKQESDRKLNLQGKPDLESQKLQKRYFKTKEPERMSVGPEGFEHGIILSRRKYRKAS